MAVLCSLDQYVSDLRAITAKENDPVKITDLVALLAKKFAQSPGWFRPEYRECDAEQGSAFTCFTKSLTTIWRFFSFHGCRTGAQPRTTTRPGPSLSVWRARRKRSVTIGSVTRPRPALPILSVVASK